MKSFFITLPYLLILFTFANSAYSLSENQIKEICQNKPRRLTCRKNLKFKKLNLLQGYQIEIPVIPFKK
ncbi:Conserved hypothetical protein [Prochlorococcus marinus str. MIT 9515]|uniref:Uncharacterized protein n=1 Tax=Prochlorococcus marinus (strain MIT 9515) TaxID=167542 RepID=A2BW91_PROM5|nr:hypothetical protein [Prochlorococcus marinus]ABM72052.1 Conserved hypothetical protein [Prochlorococcus marinus str. MIT 9515]